jgi:ectoine hydroxylase-related dioxygenase (phytanoyl-CoA dioxygenase family)
VNHYLVDVSAANGSTEIWVGSHRDTTFADHRGCNLDRSAHAINSKEGINAVFGIRIDKVEERRNLAPPIQLVVRKGSVVLRDLRLWHAGLSNPSAEPRIMLALVHTPAWYECTGQVVLPEKAAGRAQEWASRENHPVQYNAYLVGYDAILPELPKVFHLHEDKVDGSRVSAMVITARTCSGFSTVTSS